jgi:hypothetical protein
VAKGSAALTTPVNNNRPMNMGFSWGGGTPQRFFRGTVDEVSVFTRALNPSEIQDIFNAGSAGKGRIALTRAGQALGLSLSTFATGFPATAGNGGTGSHIAGPTGIAFPAGGGVLVGDAPGNVRRFPADADVPGQTAPSAPVGQNYGLDNALGLAQVGTHIYMTQLLNGQVVEINPDGTLNQVIVSGIGKAAGIVASPTTGHLFVSTIDNNQVFEVDPFAKTASLFANASFDGLVISADGGTLYGARVFGDGATQGHVWGYSTSTKALVFDSGFLGTVGIDGLALGAGPLAGNIFVNTNDGTVLEVNLTALAQTVMATNGTRGDFMTVDPNGTLLLTQSDAIVRTGGPGNFQTNKTNTSSAVTSSLNPSVYGQSVTFTAVVSPVVSGAGTPSGMVTFKDGSTTLGTGNLVPFNGAGLATFTSSSLAVVVPGHPITAVYGGDINFGGSTSLTLTQVVTQASTSTTVSPSLNPSAYGQSVTFTAKVSPQYANIPTGTVTFKDGSTALGTAALDGNGNAALTINTLAVTPNAHPITAVYGGDASFTNSTSPAVSQTVSQASTTTTLKSSLNPSAYGQSVTFTATVSPQYANTATGTVTFKDGVTALGTAALDGNGNATFTTSSLAAGSHSITASYGGDTNFTGSTSSGLAQTVNPGGPFTFGVGSTGNDAGTAVTTDAAGNVYVTGSFEGTVNFDPGPGTHNLTSAGGSDAFVAKYSLSHALVWARDIGGSGTDFGTGIAVDGAGNTYATGVFSDTAHFGSLKPLTSAGDTDGFVAKLDGQGNFLWARQMGGTGTDASLGIAVDGAGNAYATGLFSGTAKFGSLNPLTSAGDTDAFLTRLDGQGNFVWATDIGGQGTDAGLGIAVDGAGNAYATGLLSGFDAFVAKLNGQGKVLWLNTTSGTGFDAGKGIAVDGAGNAYVTGAFSGTAHFGKTLPPLTSAGDTDGFVTKLDGQGNFAWARPMGGQGTDAGLGIAVDGAGNAYVTGLFSGTAKFGPFTQTSAGGADGFVTKLDGQGTFAWARPMGGTGFDAGLGVAVDGAGNVYATGAFSDKASFGGTTLTSAGGTDAFVARLTQATGNVTELALAGAGHAANVEPLTPDQLRPVVAEALARWQAAGLDPESLRALSQVEVAIARLPDSFLGLATPGTIWVSVDAAGHGWSIDPTPACDRAFTAPGAGPAAGRMDLLTVVAHELGHELGLGDSEADDDVMADALAVGVRHVPSPADLAAGRDESLAGWLAWVANTGPQPRAASMAPPAGEADTPALPPAGPLGEVPGGDENSIALPGGNSAAVRPAGGSALDPVLSTEVLLSSGMAVALPTGADGRPQDPPPQLPLVTALDPGSGVGGLPRPSALSTVSVAPWGFPVVALDRLFADPDGSVFSQVLGEDLCSVGLAWLQGR